MNILVLGGNSERHKAWVRQVASTLKRSDHSVVFLDYLHWGKTDFADIPVEVGRAADLVNQFHGDYVIVAKSVGTGITLVGLAKGALKPKRCVFLGFPLKGIIADDKQFGYTAAFKQLPPTVIVQNEHDPWGSAAEVERYVSGVSNSDVHVLATPGNTHDYLDFELIARLVISE